MAGAPERPDALESFLGAHAPVEPPPTFAVGRVVEGWELLAFLGRGGSAEVYRVRHKVLGAVAALKILMRADDASRARFLREARILADHPDPAFPRFFSLGTVDGHPCMVIELLEPFPLPSSDRAVARYLLRVCGGVARLHALGYVHRDIKPRNILFRSPSASSAKSAASASSAPAAASPVLIDLGLVKEFAAAAVHEGDSLSVVDGKAVGVGTPRYAAPEQFTGGDISPATDIHALGMLANECFDGHPPAAWVPIIRRATSTIPGQRYASVPRFSAAIRRRHLLHDLCLASAGLLLAAAAWLAFRAVPPPSVPPPSLAVAAPSVPSNWLALCSTIVTNDITKKLIKVVLATNDVHGFRQVQPTEWWYRPVTNTATVTLVRLRPEGRNMFAAPIRLAPGCDYRIVGPGVLDAAFDATSNVTVHLWKCVFINRTSIPLAAGGVKYVLDGNAYLNFAALPLADHVELSDCRPFYTVNEDSTCNVVRLRGPESTRALQEEETRAWYRSLCSGDD